MLNLTQVRPKSPSSIDKTDGEANVTEGFSKKWREAQQRLSFKVYSLLVGSYVNTSVLDRFSNMNIHVRDLSDPQVHQVFDT